ncbi:S-layer homology domain-containing protein [Aceticella autotrophica]|uniref:S-layer homology domain-containing protein n=1 Tax=Aceticella autotrophica TaxID=2755338 RepID=A0A975GAQ9_9THEO|nr:S-layer homology domain-containing protein [Aceticella autotrophica]QSZ27550.1 S-layer homology domain-containing protein [Aceticella autotrophica]
MTEMLVGTKKRFSKISALIIAILMLISNIAATALAAPTNTTTAKQFTDIKGHWAEKEINDWISKGLIAGYEDNTFRPDNSVTRAEFVTFTDRSNNLTQTTDITFKDVKSTDWFYKEIQKAKAANIVSGYDDNTFRPNNSITREEAAAILTRLLKLQPVTQDALKGFKDASQFSDWAKDAVNTAVYYGLIKGYPDNTVGPDNLITRAETVVILNRALNLQQTPAQTSTIYDKAGTYGPQTGMNTINGDVTISAAAVTLQNTTIKGNLLISKAVGDGNVTLKNVIVEGTTTVNGGGEHSIVLEDCTLVQIIVNKDDGKIRLVAKGATKADSVTLQSGGKLEEDNVTGKGFTDVSIEGTNTQVTLKGNYDNIKVNAPGVSVEVASGTVNNLTVSDTAKDSKINIDDGVKVSVIAANAAAAITGKGTIETANINANNVTIEQKPTNTNIASGITAIIGGQSTTGSTSSNTGNSGGGSSSTPVSKPTKLYDVNLLPSGPNYIEFCFTNIKRVMRIYSIAKLPSEAKPSINEIISKSKGYDNLKPEYQSALVRIDGLNPNTEYKIYYIATDEHGNLISDISEFTAKTTPASVSITPSKVYSEVYMSVYEIKDFTFNISPSDAIVTAISDNTNVASVSTDGNTLTVAGKSTGIANITVTAKKDGYLDGQYNFKVNVINLQWQAANGGLPSSDIYTSLAIDPESTNTMYVGTYNGIYKTTDGGTTWSKLNGGLPSEVRICSLAIDPKSPNIIYTGTANNNGIYKTTDGGATWSKIGNELPQVLRILSLAVTPDASALYATVYNNVYKTTDGGITWSNVSTGLPTAWITCLAVDPNNSNTIYAGTDHGHGIYKTIDGGVSWNSVSNGLPQSSDGASITSLAIDPNNTNIIYAGTDDGHGIYKTMDGGITWKSINTGLPTKNLQITSLAIDAATGTLCASGFNGDNLNDIYRTTNGGVSWSSIGNGLPLTFRTYSLTIDSKTGILYAATSNGVYKLATRGNGNNQLTVMINPDGDYEGVNIATDESKDFTFAANPSDAVITASSDNENIAGVTSEGNKVTVTGKTVGTANIAVTAKKEGYADGRYNFKVNIVNLQWQAVNNGLSEIATTAIPLVAHTTENTIYIAVKDSVYKTTDGGATWISVGSGLPAGKQIYSLAIDPKTNTLYAATNNVIDSVYKITEGGTIWMSVGTGLPSGVWIRYIAIDPETGTVYAGTGNYSGTRGVFKIAAGDSTWSNISSGLPTTGVFSLAFNSKTNEVYAGTGSGIYKTTDGGVTWITINNGLPSNKYVNSIEINPVTGTVFAGIKNGTIYNIYKTTDGGVNWSNISDGKLPSNVLNAPLAIDYKNGILYAAISNNVYKTKDSGETWIKVSNTGWPTNVTTIDSLITDCNGIIYAATKSPKVGIYKFNTTP